MKDNRRTFIGKSLAAAALAAGIPNIVSAAMNNFPAIASKIKVTPGDIILFQGDSITDAGRNRDEREPNNSRGLGSGYAFLAAAQTLHTHPSHELHIFNRGISGNKVHQLAERWQVDCLEINPNILSILIGVNDYWHTLTGGYGGTLQVYRDDYRRLLDHTLAALPDVKLIIGEPFAVNHVKAVTDDWFPAFDEYRYTTQEIAKEYQAGFIPYHHIFAEASKSVSPDYWTTDGVHTTLAGAQLMAEAWLQVIDTAS